jgi:hypothetical protein
MFLLVGVTIALDRWSPRDEWSTPWRKVCENGFIGVAVLTLILYLNARFLSSRSRQQILWGLALLVALWFDFTGHLRDQNPTVAASAFSRGLAREFLHWETNPKLGSSRVMMCPAANNVLAHYMHPNPSSEEEYLVRRLAMEPNCNLLDGVPMTQGFFPLVPRQINAATQIPFIQTNVPFSGLLDFMGVSRITAPGRMFDWSERPTAMPLITCGQAAVFADDDVVFSMLEQTNLNLRRVVFLPPEARPCISATNQVSAHILSFDFSDKLVSLDAEGSAATMVAISQTYYPAWRAYVDGHPVRIWRANYAFQAVEMPAGRHRVQLRYEDKMFRNGLILSVLGIGACIVLWMSGEPLTRTMIRT